MSPDEIVKTLTGQNFCQYVEYIPHATGNGPLLIQTGPITGPIVVDFVGWVTTQGNYMLVKRSRGWKQQSTVGPYSFGLPNELELRPMSSGRYLVIRQFGNQLITLLIPEGDSGKAEVIDGCAYEVPNLKAAREEANANAIAEEENRRDSELDALADDDEDEYYSNYG